MNPKDGKSGFVYCAMDIGANICKIGMSEGDTLRIQSLQTGYPGTLTAEVVPVVDRRECEKYLHKVFCERRLRGEWFKGVSFKEFFTYVIAYKTAKAKQPLNSIAFYEFLYDTPYEKIHGIPLRVRDKFTKLEATVFIFKGYGFEDKNVYVDTFDKALRNLFGSAKITLLYPHFSDKHDWKYKNKKYEIWTDWFFPVYNYETGGEHPHYITNCLRFLGTCYAAIFFCTYENQYIRQMKNYCIANKIKYKVSISDKGAEKKFKQPTYKYQSM